MKNENEEVVESKGMSGAIHTFKKSEVPKVPAHILNHPNCGIFSSHEYEKKVKKLLKK